MSGHSKWSTIKHKKGVLDQRRGVLFTKLSREITVAARTGDADPDMNFRLRLAVENARSNNMPKENIERAIAKGAGTGSGADELHEINYEVYGPGGIGIIVQALTGNKNRSASDVRTKVTRAGGNMAESGAVSWNFTMKGLFTVEVQDGDPEEAALEIVDAGAEDVEVDGNTIEVTVPYEEFAAVQKSVGEMESLSIERAELAMVPNALIELEPDKAKQTLRLLDELEELDDVQKVFSNADFPDEVLAEYATA